tara:strand:+ start:69 stop:1421 length:1353 start_codon:yes stop_codon:yes gene_type:complete
MVKGVATSIITVAVLMGSLVACSGSDSEVAELREELEDVKEQLEDSLEPEETSEQEPVESEQQGEDTSPTENSEDSPTETEESQSAETNEAATVEPAPTTDSSTNEVSLEAILTDTYRWGSATADQTKILQEALGLTSDGSYGPATRTAHITALESENLPTNNVPEAPAITPIPEPEPIMPESCSVEIEPLFLGEAEIAPFDQTFRPYASIDWPPGFYMPGDLDLPGGEMRTLTMSVEMTSGWPSEPLGPFSIWSETLEYESPGVAGIWVNNPIYDENSRTDVSWYIEVELDHGVTCSRTLTFDLCTEVPSDDNCYEEPTPELILPVSCSITIGEEQYDTPLDQNIHPQINIEWPEGSDPSDWVAEQRSLTYSVEMTSGWPNNQGTIPIWTLTTNYVVTVGGNVAHNPIYDANSRSDISWHVEAQLDTGVTCNGTFIFDLCVEVPSDDNC